MLPKGCWVAHNSVPSLASNAMRRLKSSYMYTTPLDTAGLPKTSSQVPRSTAQTGAPVAALNASTYP